MSINCLDCFCHQGSNFIFLSKQCCNDCNPYVESSLINKKQEEKYRVEHIVAEMEYQQFKGKVILYTCIFGGGFFLIKFLPKSTFTEGVAIFLQVILNNMFKK